MAIETYPGEQSALTNTGGRLLDRTLDPISMRRQFSARVPGERVPDQVQMAQRRREEIAHGN